MKTTPKGTAQVADPFRVDNGKKFRPNDFDPGDTLGYGDEDKACAKEALGTGIEVLAQFQDRDAAGKDADHVLPPTPAFRERPLSELLVQASDGVRAGGETHRYHVRGRSNSLHRPDLKPKQPCDNTSAVTN